MQRNKDADMIRLDLVFACFTSSLDIVQDCSYEEILGDVYCPDGLKGKLRYIWTKKRSYDVIRSVISDSNGIEDETLYDTL